MQMAEMIGTTTSDRALTDSQAVHERSDIGELEPAALRMVAMNIVVRPLGRGRFAAYLSGRLLCRSRTPFLAAARVLKAEGVPDDTLLTMTHEQSAVVALRSTVRVAAGLKVNEVQGTPRLVPWRPEQLPSHSPSACTVERQDGKITQSRPRSTSKDDSDFGGAAATCASMKQSSAGS
jgi:hypothetical protein